MSRASDLMAFAAAVHAASGFDNTPMKNDASGHPCPPASKKRGKGMPRTQKRRKGGRKK